MKNSAKSKLRWVGIIVIGVILFGAQHIVIDEAWAQDLDLTFTPVDPCRIFDSRQPGPVSGQFEPFERRDLFVYGTINIANQGGNPAGCPSSGGEPSAVHINVTAVPGSRVGHITVFPANMSPPNASLVNYKAWGQNIANAATIKTFVQDDSEDISVLNAYGYAHIVIDVMGYYYPAP
jgi:hypothetical protein